MELVSVNSKLRHPATGRDLTEQECFKTLRYTMLCSEEDLEFILEMPRAMVAEVWEAVYNDVRDTFVIPMLNPQTNPEPEFRNKKYIYIHNLDFRVVGSISFNNAIDNDDAELLDYKREIGGDLWTYDYFTADGEIEGVLQIYRIFESLRKHVNLLLTKYKKAKLSVRMLDALSRTANFREPQDTVIPEGRTRQEKQKQARLQELADATSSNDRAMSALTVFQREYLNPQLRDVGVEIPRFTEVNPRNVLALAHQAPFVRARFQGGWWFTK
jgi:hypothetical protein